MSDGMDGIGLDWLSYTAVTPRASLQSDANNGSSKNVSFISIQISVHKVHGLQGGDQGGGFARQTKRCRPD